MCMHGVKSSYGLEISVSVESWVSLIESDY